MPSFVFSDSTVTFDNAYYNFAGSYRPSRIELTCPGVCADGLFRPRYPTGQDPFIGATLAGAASDTTSASATLTSVGGAAALAAAATDTTSASASLTAPGPAGYSGTISVNGSKLYNGALGTGVQVYLEGFNFSGLETASPQGYHPWYGNPPNWAYAGTWKGAKLARIPLCAASFLGLSCRQINSSGNGWVSTTATNADPYGDYVAAVDAAIRSAQAQGFYVILDLHWSAPEFTFGGVTGYAMPLWQPAFMNNASDLNFWKAIAARYGTQATPQTGISNAGIIFELFNEPYLDFVTGNNSTTWGIMRNGGSVAAFQTNGATTAVAQSWTALGYQTVLSAIRNLGAHNPIACGGTGYAHDCTGYATYLPTDTLSPSQVIATAHLYPAGTGPQYTDTIYPLSYPGAGSGTSSWDTPAKNLIAAGIPYLITEFGGSYGPSAIYGEPAAQYLITWAAAHGAAGWTAWTFAEGGGYASATANGSNFVDTGSKPTIGQGAIVYDAITGTTAVSITTASLPGGTQNSTYSASLAFAGGIGPYTSTLVAGTLPSGMTFSNGTLGGTPTVTASVSLTFQVLDSVNNLARKTLSLTISAGSTGTALPQLTNGALSSNWPYDYSYSGTFNYSNTSNEQSGTSGNLYITGASQFGSGWQPATNWPAQFSGGTNGLDTSGYTSISVAVYAPTPSQLKAFGHYCRSTGNDIAISASIPLTALQSIAANTWVTVTIPLAYLGMLGSYNTYKYAIQDNNQESWYLNTANFNPGNLAWIYNGDPNLNLQSGWSDNSSGTVNYQKSPTSFVAGFYALNSPPYKATVFTGSISGTTLTVSGLTGTIAKGQVVLWNGQSSTPTITGGSGGSWTLNTSQTVAAQQMVTGFNQSAINCAVMTSTNAGAYWEAAITSFDLANYRYFTFGAVPTKTGYSYKVQCISTAGVPIGNIVTATTPFDNFSGGLSPSPFNWNVYVIALSAFGLGSVTSIGGMRITDGSANTSNTTYFSAIGFYS